MRAFAAVLLLVPGCVRGDSAPDPATGLYALSAGSLEGGAVDLARWQGKVALVVNVASECGFTPQYAGLQALADELGPRGLVVLGFPSNEFGGQEPGDAQAIRAFCDRQFGVTFPLFEKCLTQAGPQQSPVYAFLGAETGQLPDWNFCKYLVGADGRVLGFFPSRVEPESTDLRSAIEAELAGA